MGKRSSPRDHPDPEYRRWMRKYPRFPGVAECVRLIRAGKARRAWAEFIADELATHASEHLPELIAAFREDPDGKVRSYVMMALDIAHPREAVEFLTEVMRSRDDRYNQFAEHALAGIGKPEARCALWEAR